MSALSGNYGSGNADVQDELLAAIVWLVAVPIILSSRMRVELLVLSEIKRPEHPVFICKLPQIRIGNILEDQDQYMIQVVTNTPALMNAHRFIHRQQNALLHAWRNVCQLCSDNLTAPMRLGFWNGRPDRLNIAESDFLNMAISKPLLTWLEIIPLQEVRAMLRELRLPRPDQNACFTGIQPCVE